MTDDNVIDMADHDTRTAPNPLINGLPTDADEASVTYSMGAHGALRVCRLCGATVPFEWRNVHLHWHHLLGTTLDVLGMLADPENWEPEP